MYYDLSLRSKNKDEIIRFLNSSAKDFYLSKNEYSDPSFPILFKACVMSGMIDLERTIRGTFGCDLHLKSVNVVLLKRMFSYGCKMLGVEMINDVSRLGKLLESFRNLNAHVYPSKEDEDFFEIDFSFLQKEKPISRQLTFYNEEVTVAGLLYILLNFLREESINMLCKRCYLFSRVAGRNYETDSYLIVNRADLEKDIRYFIGETLQDSIFGDYRKMIKYDGENFSVQIGNNEHPTFFVNGTIKDDTIVINENSLTRTYYKEKYTLEVIDKQGFIDLSNKLPSFTLVDYMYEKRISLFDYNTYKKIQQDWEILSKLNKPKFYVDKNLKILLLPQTISDFRLVSSLLLDGVQRVMLLLEDEIYKRKQINTKERFSTVTDAFKVMGADPSLVMNVFLLRNMAAHGYIMDEYFYFKNRHVVFSMDYAIKTFSGILSFLKKTDEDIYRYAAKIIEENFIKSFISAKYKKSNELCTSILETYPDYSEEELVKKNGFINNSVLDVNKFLPLMIERERSSKVLRLEMETLPREMYLFDNESIRSTIKSFCDKNGFEITEEQEEGLFTLLSIKKN